MKDNKLLAHLWKKSDNTPRTPACRHRIHFWPLNGIFDRMWWPAHMDRLQELKTAIKRFAEERDWDQFHSPKNLAMAMSVEAAEVVEIFQWLTEEQSKRLPKGKVDDLADE
jgi:hypothetical protein